jgi:hypothetical protein
VRSGGGGKIALTEVGLNEKIVLDRRTTGYWKDILDVGYWTLSEGFHGGREGVGCIT